MTPAVLAYLVAVNYPGVLALVVPCVSGLAAYDPRTKNWYVEGQEPRRFGDLGAKYPGRCQRLVALFLKNQSQTVRHVEWTDGELKGVVADLKRALKTLGCEGDVVDDVVQNERGEGYRLNEDNARDLPAWAVSRVEAAIRSRVSHPAVPRTSLPEFVWSAELLDLVRSGAWTLVQLLPGNGAEEVAAILREGLGEAEVLSIDISAISDRTQLRIAICSGELTDPAGSSEHQIARAAVGSRELLVIVVKGWGAHAQRFGIDSLTAIAEGLHAFINVRRPPVVIVVLSATPTSHLIPPAADGSLLGLTRIGQHTADADRLEAWARDQLGSVTEVDFQTLFEAAEGQLAAMQAAMRFRNTLDERRREIVAAHERAGDAILASLGPCCVDVLRGSSRRHECVRALESAGILVPVGESSQPRVQGWAANWKGPSRKS
ncbi:MAG: hypothetical protein ABL961_17525 [Vicinamibacterales bacterium]